MRRGLPNEAAALANCCVSKIEMGEALVPEINRLLVSRRLDHRN